MHNNHIELYEFIIINIIVWIYSNEKTIKKTTGVNKNFQIYLKIAKFNKNKSN